MILAHDIATCTGWAAGAGDELPRIGHHRLPEVDEGARGATFAAYHAALWGQLEEFAPSVFMFEAPILPKPIVKMVPGRRPIIIYPTNINTTTVLQGLAAVAEMTCTEWAQQRGRELVCEQTDVGEVKKQLTGNGKAEKPDMVRAARKMGLRITVHDEADAVGVWLVAVRYHARQHLHRFDRLLYGWSPAK